MTSIYSIPANELELAGHLTRTGPATWTVKGETYIDWDAARDAAAAAVYTDRADALNRRLTHREGEEVRVGLHTHTATELRAEMLELRARAARHALKSADLREGN